MTNDTDGSGDTVIVRQRQPFYWLTNASMEAVMGLPVTRRAKAMALMSVLAYAASCERDGRHDGFARSVADVGAMMGESESTVYRLAREMEEIGVLQRVARTTETGFSLPPEWLLLDPQQTPVTGDTPVRNRETLTGAAHAGVRVEEEQTSLAEARETPDNSDPVVMQYARQDVRASVLFLADGLLATFNAATGKRLGTRDASGKPSPDVKQIVGAILARPVASPDEWQAAVWNTVANPPGWHDGPVKIGTIFGPKAAGEALCNDGVRRGRAARQDAAAAESARFQDALTSFGVTT